MCLAALFANPRTNGDTKISIESSFMEVAFSMCIQQK